MDPNYLKYLSSLGIDASQYIEMQANYLRLLANCYSTNENPRPASASSAASKNSMTGKNTIKQIQNYDEAESNEISFQEDPIIKRKPANLYDEIPIKSLALPFEKFLEEEMRRNEESEESSSSRSRHSFLKRKSQKVIPTKETTPNISSPKSQFSAFLNSNSNQKVKQDQNPRGSLTAESKNLPPSTEDPQRPQLPTALSQSSHKNIRTKNPNLETEENDSNPNTQDRSLSNSTSKKPLNPKPSSGQAAGDSPKPRQEFLKRGEGKLCTQKRSSSLAKLEIKRSKLEKSQKVEEDSSIESSELESKEIIPELKDKNYLKYKKLAKELEVKKQKLEKDATEFYKMRENEVKTLESWKSEEIKKIHEDKKRIERDYRPQDVFELDNLKREIKQLKSTLSRNEEKYDKTVESLKEIIETLTTRNHEMQKILQEKTFDFLGCEKPLKSSSEVSVKMRPLRTSLRQTKEQTPKFKKPEISKVPPTFTFKLPDKKQLDRSSAQSSRSIDSPPLVEISLEDKNPERAQEVIEESKTHKISEDGKREIVFSNGVKKEIFPDGFIIVHFNNKDRKETFPDGKIVYRFFENQTVQTTLPDGLQLFEFSNGQTEKHFLDGTVEIKFPDGTVKCVFTNGDEESFFPDGTVQKVDRLGVKVIEFVNGMKDTILADGSKIRVYPDGKIRKTAPDGKVVE